MEGAVIEKGHLDDVLPHSGLMGRKKNQSLQIVLMFLSLSAYYNPVSRMDGILKMHSPSGPWGPGSVSLQLKKNRQDNRHRCSATLALGSLPQEIVFACTWGSVVSSYSRREKDRHSRGYGKSP